MLHTSKLNMAKTIIPDDVDVFLDVSIYVDTRYSRPHFYSYLLMPSMMGPESYRLWATNKIFLAFGLDNFSSFISSILFRCGGGTTDASMRSFGAKPNLYIYFTIGLVTSIFYHDIYQQGSSPVGSYHMPEKCLGAVYTQGIHSSCQRLPAPTWQRPMDRPGHWEHLTHTEWFLHYSPEWQCTRHAPTHPTNPRLVRPTQHGRGQLPWGGTPSSEGNSPILLSEPPPNLGPSLQSMIIDDFSTAQLAASPPLRAFKRSLKWMP